MQRLCKHAFQSMERRCFLRSPCKTGTKKNSDELSRVQFRDASLPGYELGSRGIEMSWNLQNNYKT
jgi:hypothetical protein